ncbi:MAG: HAD-IA family hydrolase [Candidatus Nomurabacteria bacterium]|nr:HAD-IA family hydrolase [Candidatus Nomurabacteria bacterium]
MKKKALIFDCFGVVASRVLGGWIPDNLGTKFEFDSSDIFNKIDLGQMSENEAILEFSNLVNRPPQVVRKEIDAYFRPNLELVDCIKKLKSKKYKIILLTNSSHSFFERFVFIEHPWFRELFDDIIISSQIKMIKPYKDIYLYALKQNNLKPEDAVFIDDSQSNVIGAQNVGIGSILFKDVAQLKKDLLKYQIG